MNSGSSILSYSPWIEGTKSCGQSMLRLLRWGLVVSVASWREGSANVLSGGRSWQLIVSTFNSNSSLSFLSWTSWSCWSKERADEAVSSIVMGDEETESAAADLGLDDWVDCLVDWSYVAGLLCSLILISSWRNTLKGNSYWKCGSNTFLDLRLGRAPAESDITTKGAWRKRKREWLRAYASSLRFSEKMRRQTTRSILRDIRYLFH